jgi:TolB protein
MNADGTNQHVIPVGLSYAQTPDWSPDGQWLVVQGVAEGAVNPELFKMHPDGTQLTQLTNSPELGGREDPAWSPDGSVILFQAWPGHGTHGSGELFIVPSDGGVATQVGTRHLEAQATANWQPLP